MNANQFRNNLNKGRIVKIAGNPINKHEPLRRLIEEFLFEAEGSHKAASTIADYRTNFNRVAEFVGYYSFEEHPDYEESRSQCREIGMNTPIETLDINGLAEHFHHYCENVIYPPIAEQTVITYMRNFRVFMYYAMKKGLIKKREITVKTIEAPIKNTFTQDEIHRLTRKRPNDKDIVEYRNWIMIQYLLSTGNRISSVLALNVEDIDFENNEIRVQHTKNKRPQIATLPSKLKPHLANWIRLYRCDDDGVPLYNVPLFCNAFGSRLAMKSAYDAMADYFNYRHVKWEGFHKFRHSYAANWIRSGGDSLTLKTQLGHSSLAMTNRYANLYGKAVAKSVEDFSLINKVSITSGRKKLKAKE